jgi:hypothetical protein
MECITRCPCHAQTKLGCKSLVRHCSTLKVFGELARILCVAMDELILAVLGVIALPTFTGACEIPLYPPSILCA